MDEAKKASKVPPAQTCDASTRKSDDSEAQDGDDKSPSGQNDGDPA